MSKPNFKPFRTDPDNPDTNPIYINLNMVTCFQVADDGGSTSVSLLDGSEITVVGDQFDELQAAMSTPI